MIICITLLEGPVPILDIAEVAHRLREGAERCRFLIVSDSRTEIGDPPHLARLLSMHGERHGEEGCTGANQEPAAVCHPITSFARAKRETGASSSRSLSQLWG